MNVTALSIDLSEIRRVEVDKGSVVFFNEALEESVELTWEELWKLAWKEVMTLAGKKKGKKKKPCLSE